ncbi:MAG: LON peptidase substrate-binding domain-containing protein [Vicinamibacteria bacterium]
MSESPSLLLPLFPLPDTVLFPGMPLPLHVFEQRYRKMVADTLTTHRTIGMTLLRPGWEEGYEGRPPIYPIGCSGAIARHERLEDGRYNIVLRAQSRFRVLEEHEGEPYRLATVETLSDGTGHARALDSLRKRVLATIARAADGPKSLLLQGELPHDLLVNALSQSLGLRAVEKQSLLDCDTLEARYARLIEILEFHILEEAAGSSASVH